MDDSGVCSHETRGVVDVDPPNPRPAGLGMPPAVSLLRSLNGWLAVGVERPIDAETRTNTPRPKRMVLARWAD